MSQACTRDGTPLAYTLSGPGAAADRVVLVHSLAMDGSFWAPVAEGLAGDAAVLTWDCRGHGASGRAPGPYTVELFADDLADLLDHVGWDRAVVAGASMGGCVALAFAAAYPDRTRALGLFDTTAWYGPDAPAQWAERAGKAQAEGLQSLVGFQAVRWFGDDFRARRPEVVEAALAVFLATDVQAYAESCRMLGAADLRAALPTLAMPTAVVVGEEDYATPVAMAEALHAGIAGSTLQVLQAARHLSPLERPDEIADTLRTLLERSRA